MAIMTPLAASKPSDRFGWFLLVLLVLIVTTIGCIGFNYLQALAPAEHPHVWAHLKNTAVNPNTIYVDWRRHSLIAWGAMDVLILAACLGVFSLWRRRHEAFLRQQWTDHRQKTVLTERIASLMKSANDAILLTDSRWKILEANDRALEYYGYPLTELLQMRLVDLRAPEARAAFDQQIAWMAANGGTAVFETVHQRKDRSTFPVETSDRMVTVGDAQYGLVIVRDITERKETERTLHRVNRKLRVISICDQILVRANDETKFLHDICDVISKEAGYREVWVGLAEHDEARTVHPIASAGMNDDFVGSLNITWADTERGRGPTGNAIRTGQTVIVQDIMTDPNIGPWRDSIMMSGFHSAISLPLKDEKGRTFGALTIYAGERNLFIPEETRLLEDLASDLAFGITVLRTRIRHQLSEQEVIKEKSLSDAVISNLPGAFYMYDQENRLLRCNEEFVNTFGKCPGQTGRHSLFDSVFKDDRDQVRAAIGQVFTSGQAMVEARIKGLQGVRFYQCAARRLEMNGQLFMVGSAYDITERKRGDESLLENEERFRNLAGATFEGVLFTENGRIVDVNEQCLEMFGYRREELLDKHVFELIAPSFRPLAAEAIGTGSEQMCEYQLTRKDGTFFDGEVRPRMARWGQRTRRITALRDITERKQAEKLLLARETEFRTMFEMASVGMAQANLETRCFLRVNQRLCDITGYPSDELLRLSVLDITHPDDRQHDAKLFDQVVRGELPEYHLEKRYIRKDGTIVWGNVNMTVIRDATGKPLRSMATIEDITARKMAEASLRETEEFSRQIISGAKEGIIVYGRDLRYKVWNSYMENLTGVPARDVLGRRPQEVFPFLCETGVIESLQKVLSGENVEPLEFPYQVPQTNRIGWAMDTRAPLRNSQGNIVGIITMVHDITERKRAEQQLLVSEERYRGLVNTMTDIIYVISADGNLSFIGPQVERYGFKTAELLHKPFVSFVHPEDRPRVLGDLKRTLTTGEEVLSTFRTPPRNSHIAWLEGTGRLHRNPSDTTVGVFGILRDITDHKRAEEERMRLTAAIEQAAEAVVITNTEGSILYANPAFEKISGNAVNETLGRNPRFLQSGRHSAAFYRHMWDTLTCGHVWHGRFTNKRKDGSIYEEEATISPVRDASGQIVNYIALKLDVTRELLLEQQLRQSQKMEAIGQLAGGVAHDFNNILTAIMMNLGLLQNTHDLKPVVCEILRELEAGAIRASSLTRQLLMFSRRSVLEIRTLDLNTVISGALKMLGHLLGEHIEIRFEPADEPLQVEADAGMIEQVLMNLAVNARDAMPKGGRITVTTMTVDIDKEQANQHPERRVGRFVGLSLADTGCGMDEATLKRIFEPFFTTKEPGKGTGLGLATVYGIVTQHRGWVEVESQQGRGTTFHFFLPIAAAPLTTTETKTPSPSVPTGHETLLVVEDAHDIRRVLVRALRVLGYRVLEAATGKQALTLWKKHYQEIDLLLTDMVMPEGMTGLELAEKVRAEKPGVKIVLSSGYNAEIAQCGKINGGFTYLPKPYKADLLGQTVRNCLDNKPTKA